MDTGVSPILLNQSIFGETLWYPGMAVITINNLANQDNTYTVHGIGKLYWDEHDMGRTIRSRKIPDQLPVEEARYLGVLLAEAFDTSFYFESSDNPKWRIPRWINRNDTNNK